MSTPTLRYRHPNLLLLAAVTLVLGLAACQGVEEREPEEVGATDDSQTAPPGVGDYFEAEPEAPALGVSVVEVLLHGRTIQMPGNLPSGETTFLITNTGEDEHSFEIEGNGVEEVLAAPLRPGESAELTVRLEPGTYTVHCPVGDHRSEGMVTVLRIAG